MIRFSVLTAALLLSAAADAKCYRDEDRIAGTVRHWCAAGGLAMGKALSARMAGFNPIPTAATSDDGIMVAIRVLWQGERWAGIAPGTELVFLTDTGQKITLTTPDGSGRSSRIDAAPAVGVYVTEEAIFPISPEDFAAIAQAKQVDFALYGARGRADGDLGAKELKHYRELLDTVIAPALAQ